MTSHTHRIWPVSQSMASIVRTHIPSSAHPRSTHSNLDRQTGRQTDVQGGRKAGPHSSWVHVCLSVVAQTVAALIHSMHTTSHHQHLRCQDINHGHIRPPSTLSSHRPSIQKDTQIDQRNKSVTRTCR
mmetsp:Transcript_25276/g.62597  ORF Transcript_25276/g.62597 Transcript_25276/m.62597 type:complete len:128 (-) Transcript_25276:392-775(-)